MTLSPQNRKLATLTPAEEKVWDWAFREYLDLHPKASSLDADAYAWQAVCAEFPRLREFDGVKP